MSANNYPVLPLTARDLRWQRTRAFMQDKDLDCLLVFGLKGRERYEGYLANEVLDGVVVFFADRDPIHLTWTHHRYTRRLAANMRDVHFWIDDVRVGPFGRGVVQALTEHGKTSSRVGVVGLTGSSAGELEGLVTHMMWEYVLKNLPDAQFADVSLDFAQSMLPKTPQELELVRFAAQAAEEACQTMLEITRPGIREAEIYAAVVEVLHRNSCVTTYPHVIMSVGADDPGWAPPYWTYAGGPSRTVQPGDLVQAEIMSCYGGFETQVQMAIAVEPVPKVLHTLHDVARDCYDAGLHALRPGAVFLDVATAMSEPLLKAGYYNMTPLVHSLSPAAFVGHIALNAEQLPGQDSRRVFRTIEPNRNLEIVPGMSFAFEPNACTGQHRVNIGGTVVVGEGGPEELNVVPCRMHVVS
ncbi:M24 family metallopeptidase [Streptomyces sp. NPDC096057]|uniref:M24 family metallopeptidase n=1 Tax=Streptomyces sp. NPDC096057 TaxID=3155543 RepID=UPI00331F0D60